MMKLRNPAAAPWLCAALGLAGGAMRFLLYLTGLDEKNLLRPGNPLAWGIWAVSILAAAYILQQTLRGGSNRYADSADPSVAGAAGHILAAGGILMTVLGSGPVMPGLLGMAWQVLGYLAAAGLAVAAVSRLLGRKPFFLTHTAACLFFAVHIVNHYQLWSGNPQTQDYAFSMLGAMALMLFGYYSAMIDNGAGRRGLYSATGMAAVYLCLVALSGSGYPLLYLGGAAWVMTELWSAAAGTGEREESDSHDPA